MTVEEAMVILPQILEKYGEYGVKDFVIRIYFEFVGECDIEETDYCINFERKVIYLRR